MSAESLLLDWSWLPWRRRRRDHEKIEAEIEKIRQTKKLIRADHNLDELALDILGAKDQGADAMRAAAGVGEPDAEEEDHQP